MSDPTAPTEAALEMPDIEIIHAGEDVPAVLRLASEIGLIVRRDTPTAAPEPDLLQPEQFVRFDRGVFMLYRPEWVFGQFQFQEIPAGHNKGKYSLSPGVDSSSITTFFGGERVIGDSVRLGGGVISFNNSWYRTRDRSQRRTPPDVRAVWKKLVKAVDSGHHLSGGGHKYTVLRAAWDKLMSGSAMPPFEYIDWHSPDA